MYRARDRKLDRDIALKILPAELATNAELLRRFEQEARAASALNHPSVITIYEIGQFESTAYIAMELVEGHDLREVIDRERLPLKQCMRIASKIADGLAAAHERGIVHRDLKPENLMISPRGFVKILDFGLAKLTRVIAQTEATLPQTTPGAVFGTVGYMSPEQASGKPTDYRSDQFSFGIILYEMVTGHRPFDRATMAETMTAIIREDPPPAGELDPTLPAELQHILDRCLAKDREERYASTRDLASDLRDIRNSLTHGSHSGHSVSREPRKTKPDSRRRLTAVASGAALVLIALAAAYLAYHGAHRIPQVKSIAVLPFRDVSNTANGQAFIDGISDTISARIAQSGSLHVAAPFDGSPLPAGATLAEIAQKRGADVLLRGSIQRSSDQVRVSYELIEPLSGKQLSGDTVTGSASNIFALEDLVANSVMLNLRIAANKKPGPRSIDLNAADQQVYIEAVGLLQRPKDDKAIDGAISRLESLLSNARDSGPINATLGRAYLSKYLLTQHKDHLSQADIFAERAVQLDHDLPQAHVVLGEVWLRMGRNADALAEFDKAIGMQPAMYEAIAGLAAANDALGRGADAERLYEQAIVLRPDIASSFNRYGSFCYRAGRYEKAAQLFAKVTELLPDSARGYSNRGAALQALGKYTEAIETYRHGIAIGATGDGYSNLGTCQFLLGQYREAAASFERATRLTPDNFYFWGNLGDAYRWLQKSSDAAAAYDHAIVLVRQQIDANPKDAFAHARLASLLTLRGQEPDAVRTEMARATMIDPRNPDVLYHAALIAQLHGEHDAAIDSLARAVSAGFSATMLQQDPEFISIRHDPRFPSSKPNPRKTS